MNSFGEEVPFTTHYVEAYVLMTPALVAWPRECVRASPCKLTPLCLFSPLWKRLPECRPRRRGVGSEALPPGGGSIYLNHL